VAAASSAVTIAAATITSRQPKASAARRSGTPADTAPTTPTASATPAIAAKREGSNQWVDSFSIDTNATPTAAPTRKRPSATNA